MAKKNEIMRYDEELAKQAAEVAEQYAGMGGGQYFSTKGGILKFNDAPMPDNQVGAVILDSILVNSKYDGDYDPESPQPPICYAFSRKEKEMAPHAEASDPQCGSCSECEHNKFGSGKGRGKACKNGIRMALLPAGTFDGKKFKPFNDSDQLEKGEIGFLNVPPTSINGFAAFAKQISGTLRRPPNGIYTKVRLVPEGSFFTITFEPIVVVPDGLMGVVMKRREEARSTIEQPFPKAEDAPAKPKRGAAKRGKKF